MKTPTQLLLDLCELGVHPLGHRHAPELEPTLATCEALAPGAALSGGTSRWHDDRRRSVGSSQNEVIAQIARPAHGVLPQESVPPPRDVRTHHITPRWALAPLQSPQVEDKMEIDVREQGRNYRPSRRPPFPAESPDRLP